MLKHVKSWRWGDTWVRRFVQVLLFVGIPGFLASLISGAVRSIPLSAIMLEIWMPIFLLCVVIAAGQATIAKGGTTFWRLWSRK